MSGKGSGRRPMSTGLEQFESNWEKAFSAKTSGFDNTKAYDHGVNDRKGDMLREVNYDGLWQHSCTVEMSVVWIGKNETCNYCGAWEEDGL